MDEPKPLSEIAGTSLRRIRTRSRATADSVATAARSVGLTWTGITVAHIETGRRSLLVEELILLPPILSQAIGRPVSLHELLNDDLVRVPGTGARSTAIPMPTVWRLLAGELVDAADVNVGPGAEVSDDIIALLPADVDHDTAISATLDAKGEAEQAIARKLGVEPVQVAYAARVRWSRSVGEERDSRIPEIGDPNLRPRSLQAKRGHVTRELLVELEIDLEHYPRAGG